MIVNYLKYILALLLVSIATSPVFSEVKAYLNQSSFYDDGNPITLKIETTQNKKIKPNLAPLKKDFTVLDDYSNSQSFFINGQYSFLTIWTIELQTNQKGALQIPSISIGKEKTKALVFSILDLPPEVTAETKKHVFLETSIGIEGSTTFVQQQIPYTVKLFYDSTVQTAEMVSPDINPNIKNAIVEQLGREKRYRVVKSGKRFNVVEKNFVISPEKSGILKIPATTVKGKIALSGGDSQELRQRMDETDMINNFFNDSDIDQFLRGAFNGRFFNRRSHGPSKPFTIKGEAIEVDVLPVEKSFTGSSWLPAEDLIIKDSWARRPPELKVGEPVTRVLTLEAKGLAGSQIPDLSIPKPNHMKVYPDKVQPETITDGNTVYGIQRINISYIPDASGKVTIPEIKVDWWDVKNKKQKTFVLPAWNLNVIADPTKVDETDVTSSELLQEPPPPSILEEKSKVPASSAEADDEYWTWKFIVIAILLLIFSALLYGLRNYLMKGQKNKDTSHNVTAQKDVGALRLSLLQACKSNDKQLAAKTLLKYAQAFWDDESVQNLGMIVMRLERDSDAKIIQTLEKSLYSSDSRNWNGAALSKLIESGLPQKKIIEKQNEDGLTPLYPA